MDVVAPFSLCDFGGTMLCSKDFGLTPQLHCFPGIWHGRREDSSLSQGVWLEVAELLYFIKILGPPEASCFQRFCSHVCSIFQGCWSSKTKTAVSKDFGPHGPNIDVPRKPSLSQGLSSIVAEQGRTCLCKSSI